MIPSSDLFDQSTMAALLEHDPLIARLPRLLCPTRLVGRRALGG